MIFSRRPLAALGALCLILPSVVSAQTAEKPDEKKKEEVVELSPFVVTSGGPDGYMASESVTGSRVATPIKDLPFAINVVTSEFLNDFDFFDLSENMAYTSSLSGLDTQGNYNLRGFGATFQLRNGFYRLGLVDRVNVDRVEIIKGPNAAIYGQTSPAGIVNIITKRPKSTPSERLSLTAGDNNFYRGELNVTGPVGTLGGAKISHLFSASGMNRDYDAQYANLHQRAFSEAVLAKFSDRSSLLVEYEYSERKSIAAVTATPWVVTRVGTSNTYLYTPEIATQFKNFNQSGPNGREDRDLSTLTATYELRINPIWSTRVSAYSYDRHALNFDSSSGDQFYPVDNVIRSRNPVLSHLDENGGAIQADLLAHYRTNHNRLEHKTLITFDWSVNKRARLETKPLTSQFPNGTIVNVSTPNYDVPDLSLWKIITRNDHTQWDVKGVYLRQQTALFKGRLLAFGGVRYDQVDFDLDFGNQYNVGGSSPGSLNNAGTKDKFTDHAVSPSIGLNFKLTPSLALYSNYSRSFFPNAQSSRLGSPQLPNERAMGYDAGIKASYFDDKLVFTLGGFDIVRDGVRASVIESGSAVDVAAGQQKATGVEFDFTWRVKGSLTLLGGYGYTDAYISANGRDTDSVGRRPNRVPRDNGGLALKYSLPGMFKGFAFNAGLKYIGKSYPNSLATVAGGTPDLARRNTVTPSYETIDAGLSYRWKLRGGSFGQSVRVSVKNLLDRDYLSIGNSAAEGRKFFFAYTVTH
jgi:outer membrane receptor protein involved in Fe transport